MNSRRAQVSLTVAVLLLGAPAVAQGTQQVAPPSILSGVLTAFEPPAGESNPSTRAAAAELFMGSLRPQLRALVALPLEDAERRRWTNLPSTPDDGGLPLGSCNEEESRRVCQLLAAVLSPSGYRKIKDIMLADDQLLPNGRPRVGFGVASFHLAIFGPPSATDRWALQLDGHHLALNLTFQGESVTHSPSFYGAQPATWNRTGEPIAPLGSLMTDAYALICALPEDLRTQAVVAPLRGQLICGPGQDGVVPKPQGASLQGLSGHARDHLLGLIRHYVSDLPEPAARKRMEELESELDSLTFAWSGPPKPLSDVSFRLQGPSLIIEFACQDLGGNPLQHLHSMYRDPRNEYGASLSSGR